MNADIRKFKNPNCPAAYSARLAYELKTKRSLKTGKPLTQTELAWRSGALDMRKYESNWYNAVNSKYGNNSKYKSSNIKSDNFMQHNFSDFNLNELFDDIDNIQLLKK